MFPERTPTPQPGPRLPRGAWQAQDPSILAPCLCPLKTSLSSQDPSTPALPSSSREKEYGLSLLLERLVSGDLWRGKEHGARSKDQQVWPTWYVWCVCVCVERWGRERGSRQCSTQRSCSGTSEPWSRWTCSLVVETPVLHSEEWD